MPSPILLRGARQLVTLRGPSGPRRGAAMRELAIIPDGALLISDGVIQDVGPSRRVENLAAARNAAEIAADGRVVIPGLIDSHTRLVGGESRLEEYEARLLGVVEEAWDPPGGAPPGLRELRAASKQRLGLLARKVVKQLVRHGTTSLEAKSPWGVDARTDLKILRVLESLHGKPLDVFATYYLGTAPAETQRQVEEYIEWLCADMLPRLRARRLARFVHVRVGQEAYSADQARRILSAARALGLIPKVTACERASDGGVDVAVELEAASADRLDCITRAEMDLLARSPTVATLLPGVAFHQRLRRLPGARELIEAGAAVALATGLSPDGCPSLSLPAVMSLACLELGLTPAEALTAATINAAHALRCATRLGSLEYGKDADLVMLNVGDYRELTYQFGVNLVAMVMKRGQVLFPRMEF
jgi:imidazolonepropionase